MYLDNFSRDGQGVVELLVQGEDLLDGHDVVPEGDPPDEGVAGAVLAVGGLEADPAADVGHLGQVLADAQDAFGARERGEDTELGHARVEDHLVQDACIIEVYLEVS